MNALRTSSMLIRLVLAWFVLTLGVAIASPVMHPESMEMVCSSDGSMKVVLIDDDGAAHMGHHTLDCPMCLAATLPPSPVNLRAEMSQPLAYALRPIVAAHIAALVGAPLPPRGPLRFFPDPVSPG
ncbi:DUF2946 family protein [Diaphorobacter aerolatus]|uniref:DUF2946 domain-containing protein n=1 Tax=Diaphorobacter aerolatus TaxID=1288495 RepID=A0A7H0GME1_9BURK|nr:DUF2946 family protein [Diaphorobacter aerolatus]QNP49457.1 hypothetical protein H9K75_05390 [Diaphorobacter aerolatus]